MIARFSTELLLITTLLNAVASEPSMVCGLEPLKVTVCVLVAVKLPLLLQSPAMLKLFVPAAKVVPTRMVRLLAMVVVPARSVLVPLPLVTRLP